MVNTVEYMKPDGTNVTIDDVREGLSDLSIQLHTAKQQQILQEKKNIEDKKAYQAKAKLDLKSKKIPELYVSEKGNNIAIWLGEILSKDRDVMKYDPRSKDMLIHTIKENSGQRLLSSVEMIRCIS